MLKRKRDVGENVGQSQPPMKRNRVVGKDFFLDLSDELILRILSFLSVQQLARTEEVSFRLRRLASDNELWREKYYLQFVRPRARKIPGLSMLSQTERETQALYYSSKSARWLEYNPAAKEAGFSDWKRRYMVKLNWTKGRCKAHEVALDCPPQPQILVRICRGTIYTADERKLRSYSQRTRPQILNTYYWPDGKRPTAMAVQSSGQSTWIVAGFSDGSLEVLQAQDSTAFEPYLRHTTAEGGAIASLAISWPYILTVSTNQQLALAEVVPDSLSMKPATTRNLASLRSEALLLPVSLSIRRTPNTLVASIAYSFNRLNAGWCLGLQEIRLSLSGEIVGSRLTSTVDTPMKDHPLRKSPISSRSASTAPFALHPNLRNPPTSLSHSGCYILAGLPDNTLMVYTVTSNQERLDISGGRRLFGHTSSVSGAEVSDRGKALSVSARGDEIRVWELEDLLSSWSLQKTSTQLRPESSVNDLNNVIARRGVGLGLALKDVKNELALSRHWVGFDDEQVVVLGERDQRQILSCYDFA